MAIASPRHMVWAMGYIIVAGLLVLFLLFVGIAIFSAVNPSRSPNTDRSGSPDLPDPGHPLSRTEPAADEPTPGASDTADSTRVRNAQRRVPPA